MLRALLLPVVVGAVVLGVGPTPWSVAAEDAPKLSAADLLPPSTAVYAEISHPPHLIDLMLDHPIHQRLQELDEYRKAFESPQYQQALVAVKAVEGAVEMRWRPAAKLLTEGGVYFAADPQTQGIAILVKSGDGEKLAALRDAIFTFVRADAKNKGGEDPVSAGEYRGIPAHGVGNARIAICGDWLVATNKSDLGKSILDRYLTSQEGGKSAVLAGNTHFQEALASKPQSSLAWVYADLAALREAGVAKDAFAGPRDNPLAELLVGGLIGMANETPYATLSLDADKDHLRLAASVPFDPKGIGDTRRYYFGSEGEGEAPPPAAADQMVFQFRAYRDLAEFWAAAPDLFEENITAKFAEADGTLTTLLAGRDFGDEVLASLEPGLQIVVARQELPQTELPAPDVKLPAFAALFRLKEGASVRRNLKVSFQSLIGFLNVVGAMNGQPPLEQSNEQEGDMEIVSGKYLPPVNEQESRGLINYNFSPTAVFAGDRLILASTRNLAEELANPSRRPADNATGDGAQVNTQARLDTGVLRSILDDNREQLIAQNMLEKGHSREEAEKEIGGLLELLTWIRGSAVQITRDEQWLRLDWKAVFAPPQVDQP